MRQWAAHHCRVGAMPSLHLEQNTKQPHRHRSADKPALTGNAQHGLKGEQASTNFMLAARSAAPRFALASAPRIRQCSFQRRSQQPSAMSAAAAPPARPPPATIFFATGAGYLVTWARGLVRALCTTVYSRRHWLVCMIWQGGCQVLASSGKEAAKCLQAPCCRPANAAYEARPPANT